MKKSTYQDLKLKATICPQAEQWPAQYTHWQKLGGAVAEARSRASQTLAAMDVIDANADLTPEGKSKERLRIAEKAISDFNKSSALSDAQAAVAQMQTKWAAKVAEIIKAPEDPRDVAIHAEIRGRVANMSKEDRFMFLQKCDDQLVASALLTAPAFLWNATEAEAALVRSRMEKIALTPEVLEAKDATTKATVAAEKGWRAAIALIEERAGLRPVKARAA